MTAGAIDAAAARRHAASAVRRSGTSFAAGMAILPKKRRDAMHAIYAFCREVDDIADDSTTAAEKMRRLYEWRAEIDRIYKGRPQFPSGVALLQPIWTFDLPKQEFQLMIEGMEMDADGPIVAPTMDRLFAYTRRVAGTVGKLSMKVFGAPAIEASDRFALALADALQLTNILRDVAEDAKIGRLYLPAELLEKHGAEKDAAAVGCALTSGFANPEGALGGEENAGLKSALHGVARDLAEIARRKFAEAREALSDLDWRTVRPALLMMGVYQLYLRKMEARGWERLGEPIAISRSEKLAIAIRYALARPRTAD